MRSVGISELKQNVSRLVRTVQRTGEEVSVTVRGEVVAVLGPAGPHSRGKRAKATTVADLRRLARKIGKHWPKGVSAVDAVRDARR